MQLITKLLSVGTMILFSAGAAFAAEDRATRDEAIAFVNKAVAHINKVGGEKAFLDFSKSKAEDGEFIDRDLYIFVYDMKGVMRGIGNGNAKKMVGKDLMEFRDADGNFLVKGLLAAVAKTGKGWHPYKFPNPVSKNVEAKEGYCEKVDNKGDPVIICSGIYKV